MLEIVIRFRFLSPLWMGVVYVVSSILFKLIQIAAICWIMEPGPARNAVIIGDLVLMILEFMSVAVVAVVLKWIQRHVKKWLKSILNIDLSTESALELRKIKMTHDNNDFFVLKLMHHKRWWPSMTSKWSRQK